MKRINQVRIAVDATSRMQFSESVRLFLLDCKLRNLSPYTIRGYHDHLTALHRDMEAWSITLHTLQPSDLSDRMVQHMRHRGLATNTINGRIRACQQFCKFLFAEGILDRNLAEGVKPNALTKPALPTFTEQQLQSILNEPDQQSFNGQRDYAIILVFLDTGLRVNELAALQVSDIHWDERYLLVDTAKNRKARRVPFHQTTSEALHAYLLRHGTTCTPDLWITRFQKTFTRTGIIQMISRYCKQAGVPGTSHKFRHTMAKMFLLNGGSVEALQYILGHSSLKMTRYYVDLFPADLHQQHKRYSPLERLFHERQEVE